MIIKLFLSYDQPSPAARQALPRTPQGGPGGVGLGGEVRAWRPYVHSVILAEF